eukprot:6893538-Prymnesium_polylepis.1
MPWTSNPGTSAKVALAWVGRKNPTATQWLLWDLAHPPGSPTMGGEKGGSCKFNLPSYALSRATKH